MHYMYVYHDKSPRDSAQVERRKHIKTPSLASVCYCEVRLPILRRPAVWAQLEAFFIFVGDHTSMNCPRYGSASPDTERYLPVAAASRTTCRLSR